MPPTLTAAAAVATSAVRPATEPTAAPADSLDTVSCPVGPVGGPEVPLASPTAARILSRDSLALFLAQNARRRWLAASAAGERPNDRLSPPRPPLQPGPLASTVREGTLGLWETGEECCPSSSSWPSLYTPSRIYYYTRTPSPNSAGFSWDCQHQAHPGAGQLRAIRGGPCAHAREGQEGPVERDARQLARRRNIATAAQRDEGGAARSGPPCARAHRVSWAWSLRRGRAGEPPRRRAPLLARVAASSANECPAGGVPRAVRTLYAQKHRGGCMLAPLARAIDCGRQCSSPLCGPQGRVGLCLGEGKSPRFCTDDQRSADAVWSAGIIGGV